MDPRERIGDAQEAMRVVFEGLQSNLWTALPGLIEAFDADAQTATIQPAIKLLYTAPDGTKTWLTMPLLIHCPVVFPQGGGFSLTFPVTHGDECLILFSSRCIDAWWSSGGIQQQAELRLHDLSDGFALMGVRSTPRKLSNVSTNSTQLRSDDGTTMVEVAGGQIVNIVAPVMTNIIGPLTVSGESTFEAPVAFQSTTTTTGLAMMSGGFASTGPATANGHNISETHTHFNSGGPSTGVVST